MYSKKHKSLAETLIPTSEIFSWFWMYEICPFFGPLRTKLKCSINLISSFEDNDLKISCTWGKKTPIVNIKTHKYLHHHKADMDSWSFEERQRIKGKLRKF